MIEFISNNVSPDEFINIKVCPSNIFFTISAITTNKYMINKKDHRVNSSVNEKRS